MALMYCMDYFPADYYWLVTTSVILSDEINYKQMFEKAFEDLSDVDVGVLSTAVLLGPVRQEASPEAVTKRRERSRIRPARMGKSRTRFIGHMNRSRSLSPSQRKMEVMVACIAYRVPDLEAIILDWWISVKWRLEQCRIATALRKTIYKLQPTIYEGSCAFRAAMIW